MSDDADKIVEVVGHLRAQHGALQELMSSVESSLADVTAAIESGSERTAEMKDILASVESTLADVASGIENSGVGQAIKSVAEALSALKPTVTVNVPQPPAPIIHVMPSPDQKGATWEIRSAMIYGERVMTLKRTA